MMRSELYASHLISSDALEFVLPAQFTAVTQSRLHGTSRRPEVRTAGSRTMILETKLSAGTGHLTSVERKQVEVIDFRGRDVDEDPAELLRIICLLSINRRLQGQLGFGLKAVELLPTPDAGRIYFVTPTMDVTFDSIVQSRQRFSVDHIRYFMYQLLRGLKYLHSANAVVGHVSPACTYTNMHEDGCISLTQSMLPSGTTVPRLCLPSSNAYLAPEQLVEDYGVVTATTEGDVWGVGCFAAELIVRKPLFGDGSLQSARDAISCIFKKTHSSPLGTEGDGPEHASGDDSHPDAIRDGLRELDSGQLALFNDSQLMDFLSHCLHPNPQHRWSAEQLLAHPFLGNLHDPSDEPSAEQPVSWSVPRQGVHESSEAFVDRLHGMILLEMIATNPEEVYWLEGE